jgi:hypothetical protein
MNLGWPPNVTIVTLGAFPQMSFKYPQVPWPTNVAITSNVKTQSFPTIQTTWTKSCTYATIGYIMSTRSNCNLTNA